MVSPAMAIGTGASPAGTKAYSFWVGGNDLVNYLDWHSVRIDMDARGSANSRAAFRIENPDGSLDFTDLWGYAWGSGIAGPVGYPLQEVVLYDHVHQEPLFGGYIVGVRVGIAYADKTTIEIDCVGYSWLLDATFIPAAATFLAADELGQVVMALAGQAGLRDGVRASAGSSFSPLPTGTSVENSQVLFNDVVVPAYTTLRQAIVQAVGGSVSRYGIFIDNFKRLCFVDDTAWASTAPMVFSPTTPAESLEMSADYAEYASHVYIQSTTAAGRGWYEARMLGDNGTPQVVGTYRPVPVDVTISQDDATEAFTREVYGEWELASHQSGNNPSYRVTKTGTFGWRLGQGTTIDYPQLNFAGATPTRVVVVAYGLAFAGPLQPVFNLTLGRVWGLGGFGSSIPDASATSAEYAKRRLTVRTS